MLDDLKARLYALPKAVAEALGPNAAANQNELSKLVTLEGARGLKDVGLTAAEADLVARSHPDVDTMLGKRLALEGMTEEDVQHMCRAALQDMQRVCSCCKDHKKCKRDQAAGDGGETAYCPNNYTIEALQKQATIKTTM